MKITSYWTYETGKWDEDSGKFINRKISEIKTKELEIEIDKTDHGDNYGPILRFKGGPTGFESYYINELLEDEYNHEDFGICGGTINSWARCWVKTKDINKILEQFRNKKWN